MDESFAGTVASTQEGLRAGASLNDGGAIPWVGLGVHKMGDDRATEAAVRAALEIGYRHIDTASLYGNERGVGAAVRASGVPREELFVTTKLWNDDMRSGRQREAFEASLERLGLDYVDLYLLHWPIEGRIVESWKVLEALRGEGRARAIGVSNFMVPHLEALLSEAEVSPAVNQIEFHPYLRSPELLAFCAEKGIRMTAWSPLMAGGPILDEPALARIAREHGKTVAQVILRWDLQHGVVTIPKSSHRERMEENASIFDFALNEEEMAAIDALDRGQRSGADPFNFGF